MIAVIVLTYNRAHLLERCVEDVLLRTSDATREIIIWNNASDDETKEYLESGLVLFKDTCSKDWAMNSTTQSRPVTAATARTCLAKENLAADVVLFRDLCSGEWAKNPPDQQAEAPAAR